MILDKKREFDHRTGIRHDSFQEKFFIGSSVVEILYCLWTKTLK
jgi:hypothetical protein